jgi:hypothetical protein
MIKHVWTIACRESLVDEDTNNISLLEAFENLQFDINITDDKYKKGVSLGVNFNLEMVSLFFRDTVGKSEKIKETLIILDPKGVKLGEAVADIEFQPTNDRMRNIMKFDTLAVTTSGTYLFQSYLSKSANLGSKEPVAVVPINIKVTVNGEAV